MLGAMYCTLGGMYSVLGAVYCALGAMYGVIGAVHCVLGQLTNTFLIGEHQKDFYTWYC